MAGNTGVTSLSRTARVVAASTSGLAVKPSMRPVSASFFGRHQGRSQDLGTLPGAPYLLDGGDVAGDQIWGQPPERVLASRVAGIGIDEDETHCSFGVGGRKEHRGPRALAPREKGRPFGSDGVHDRTDVVLPRLEGRDGVCVQSTGAAKSPRIEGDEPGERRQPGDEPADRRLVPNELDGGVSGYRQHHVRGAVARDLVGEIGAFSCPGLPGRKPFGHCQTVCLAVALGAEPIATGEVGRSCHD